MLRDSSSSDMLRDVDEIQTSEPHGRYLISRPRTRWVSSRAETKANILGKRAISASIVLQSMIYFNTLFSATFAILQLTLSIWKVQNRFMYYRQPAYAIDLVTFFLWVIVEPVRLFAGFFGNLNEKVSEISIFMLLTVCPQLFILFYQTINPMMSPFMYLGVCIVISFSVVQLIFGYITLKKLFARNKADFMFLVINEK